MVPTSKPWRERGRPTLTTGTAMGQNGAGAGRVRPPSGGTTVKKFVVLLLVLVGLGAIVAVAIKATQE